MTCAGITGLAICQAALQDYQGLSRNKLQNDANRARNVAFLAAALAHVLRRRRGFPDRGAGSGSAQGAHASGSAAPPSSAWVDAFRPGAAP